MSELELYRREIDEVDAALVPLFLKRMTITEKVGEYKKREGIPILDSNREKQVIEKKLAFASTAEERADIADLYESILAISRRQQRHIVKGEDTGESYRRHIASFAQTREPISSPRVVYQGEPGCYSEEASVAFFGDDVDEQGLPWFDDVFSALKEGRADYAVVPIENSSTGTIRQVYDLLSEGGFYIVGECAVRVNHTLSALPGVCKEDIRTVYSHEQGLMQCDRFLDQHPTWTRVPTLDTAGSAKQVRDSGDRAAAAVCSARAAKLYGLTVLEENINHNSANETRFAVVSPYPEEREGRNKISVLFSLPHKAGALHEVLTIFAVHGMNLLKLESRPIPEREWEYMFFLECSGNLSDTDTDGILRELSFLTADFRILGNFKGL